MLDVQILLAAAQLGDPQRNDRAHVLVRDLMRGAAAGTTGAVPWAHTMGAYRFWNNAAIPLDALYRPCRAALAQLVPPGARAYVVHDWSVVDYSGHARKRDRRRIGNAYGTGYELGTALVLDAAGHALGPVAQALRTADGVWSSEAAACLPDADHHAVYVAHVAAAADHLPGRDLVHVIDREGDDVWLQRALAAAHETYVIRARHLTRRVQHHGQDVPLAAAVAAVPLAFHRQVERPDASAQLWIGETTVVFAGKSWRGRHRGAPAQAGAPLAVRVVVAELRGDGTTDRWVLLTTWAASRVEVVEAYVFRWRVERLFFFVKVGFRLETWNQHDGGAIARRLALASLAAMVLYQLQHAAHAATTAADARATLAEVARWGGHAAPAGTPPGPLVLLRGLMWLIAAYSLLEQLGADGVRARVAHLQTIVRFDLTPPPLPGAKRYPKPTAGGV